MSTRRVFVEKRPLSMLIVANRDQQFSLEEVLETMWSTRSIEVRDQCVEILTTYRFEPTSNLATIKLLRETILHESWSFEKEKTYERLFLVYLRYGQLWYLPKGVSEEHAERRRRRVTTTMYNFLVKLYCETGSDFESYSPILKALLRYLIEKTGVFCWQGLTKEDLDVAGKLLVHFATSFQGSTKKNPSKIGESFNGELRLIAKFIDETSFQSRVVESQFKMMKSYIHQGRVIIERPHNSSKSEGDIAKRCVLVHLEVLCEKLEENRRGSK